MGGGYMNFKEFKNKKKVYDILGSKSHIYWGYLDTLVRNADATDVVWLQDLVKKEDYEKVIKPYLLESVIECHGDEHKELNKKIYKVFKDMKLAPGMILEYGDVNRNVEVSYGDVSSNTIFDLASTSKIFTATAIMSLVDAGLLDLREPVTKYAPQFVNLKDVTVYDLLKFRVSIVTTKRVDAAKSKEEAEEILFNIKVNENQIIKNAYTDMGAMVLKYVVEAVSKMPFDEYACECIFKKAKMNDTCLVVPEEKLENVADQNYSSIVDKNGNIITNKDIYPGTVHDPKARVMGAGQGNAPGHAGYFSTKNDMVKFAKAMLNGKILSRESLLDLSNTATAFNDEDKKAYAYGSLVYLKQLDPAYLGVYRLLSGKAFMSPGFAGTSLVIDPLNNFYSFIAAARLADRIYSVASSMEKNIVMHENELMTYGGKIISSSYARKKEEIIKEAYNELIGNRLGDLLAMEENRERKLKR